MEDFLQENEIKTDFAISLGCACRPAYYMREYKLRRMSCPLDWMMFYSLEDVIKLFKSDFSTFFAERKVHHDKAIGKYNYVEDVNNGMISIHGFPLDEDVDAIYKDFSNQMSIRYFRMKELMTNADNVLFISNREDSKGDFMAFLEEMQILFDGNFTLLNIRYSNDFNFFREKLSSRSEFIEFGFADVHPNGSNPENPDFWKGNPQGWQSVMQKIKLSEKFAKLDFQKNMSAV